MNTHILLDPTVIVDQQERYLQERDNDTLHFDEVFDRWFSDLCVDWLDALATQSTLTHWTHNQLYRCVVGLTSHLSFRDALIISSMDQISSASLISLVTFPMHKSSSQLVKNSLARVFNDSDTRPDEQRVNHALTLLGTFIEMYPREFCAPLYAIRSYLLWWLGRNGEALEANCKAMNIDPNYTLSKIISNALAYSIFPAWCSCAHQKEKS